MDASVKNQKSNSFEKTFQGMQSCLVELSELYLKILTILKEEKKHLISSSIDDIWNANSEKEQLLKKISGVEGLRLGFAASLARELNLSQSSPRLLEIAEALKGSSEERALRHHYHVLSDLMTQVQDMNQENETLAQAALRNIGGAMENIKDTLTGSKTYHKTGQYKSGPEKSGNFISKEA